MVTCLASARCRPEPPTPDWAEIHALLNAIRAPSREDILAVVQGTSGDALSESAAERIADALLALFQGSATRSGP